jgi:hypothetical protein
MELMMFCHTTTIQKEYCNCAQGAGRAYNDCDICMAIKNAGRVSIDARV